MINIFIHRSTNKNKKYALGVDLHKNFAYCTLIDKKKKIARQEKVSTDRKETKDFLATLPSSCWVVVEPVSNWFWYADLVKKHKGLSFHLVHSKEAKAIASARLKNDKVDSQTLAYLAMTDLLPEAYVYDTKIRDLRSLTRARAMLKKQATKWKNFIHAITWKEGQKYSGKYLFGPKGKKWLDEMEFNSSYHKPLIEITLENIDHLQRKIEEINTFLKQEAEDEPIVTLLTTIKGIGYYTALSLKAEIIDIERFPRPASLANFFGLTTRVNSSAGKDKLGHITKQGSRHIRWLMVQAACCYARTTRYGHLYNFYRRIKRKRGAKIALVALARKLTEVVWIVWKRKEPFKIMAPRKSDHSEDTKE